eukprot:scaffold20973_cov53-Phaeocystis_antarctica.AAC.8
MQGSTSAPMTSPCSKERGSPSASVLPPLASGATHPPPFSTRAPSKVRTAKRTCTGHGAANGAGSGAQGDGWSGAHPADSSFVGPLILVRRLAHDLAHHAAARVRHRLHLAPTLQAHMHAQRAPPAHLLGRAGDVACRTAPPPPLHRPPQCATPQPAWPACAPPPSARKPYAWPWLCPPRREARSRWCTRSPRAAAPTHHP